jgi:hypothetical protein
MTQNAVGLGGEQREVGRRVLVMGQNAGCCKQFERRGKIRNVMCRTHGNLPDRLAAGSKQQRPETDSH